MISLIIHFMGAVVVIQLFLFVLSHAFNIVLEIPSLFRRGPRPTKFTRLPIAFIDHIRQSTGF